MGASSEGPILVTGTRGGYKFVAIGFDPRDSDLPLRIAWPLLLLNSINFFTDKKTITSRWMSDSTVW